LEAPDVVAELRSHEDARLGEREEVAVDRRAVERLAREALGELAVADGRAEPRELPQDHEPLLRHADAPRNEELTELVIFPLSRLGRHTTSISREFAALASRPPHLDGEVRERVLAERGAIFVDLAIGRRRERHDAAPEPAAEGPDVDVDDLRIADRLERLDDRRLQLAAQIHVEELEGRAL